MSVTVVSLFVAAFVILMTAWVSVAAALAVAAGPLMVRLWREPVFRHPTLVIESDDWGTGPAEQVEALKAIRDRLLRFRDNEGRPAHMTLALVLGEPDGPPLSSEPMEFRRRSLAHPAYRLLLHELQQGKELGVFTLQLHGGEHFNPTVLLSAAEDAPEILAWLKSTPGAQTEDLPPQLQTRWADCGHLPSRALASTEIEAMVGAEVEEFQEILGCKAEVVVPSTFIWTHEVESAWASRGVDTAVTPGCRFKARDAGGRPAGADGPIFNGETGNGTLCYVVRDIYFEPALGHTADTLLPQVLEKFSQRRPALLETHRANFISSEKLRDKSLEQMTQLIGNLQKLYPEMRFLPTVLIARAIRSRDSKYLDDRTPLRIATLLIRGSNLPRLGRLIRLVGLKALAGAVERAYRASR